MIGCRIIVIRSGQRTRTCTFSWRSVGRTSVVSDAEMGSPILKRKALGWHTRKLRHRAAVGFRLWSRMWLGIYHSTCARWECFDQLNDSFLDGGRNAREVTNDRSGDYPIDFMIPLAYDLRVKKVEKSSLLYLSPRSVLRCCSCSTHSFV